MKLSYIIDNEAWYHEINKAVINSDYVYEINIMINHGADAEFPGGGVGAEFMIRWYVLDGTPIPHIEIFGDCWKFLPQLQELFSELSVLGKEGTPTAVLAVLQRVGAKDRTKRTHPYR